MSKSFKFLIVPILVIGFLRCSSVSVSTDYDPGVDFSCYKTYKWGSANDPNDALLSNQLMLQRVYEAIDKTMRPKGFTKVTSNLDFVVYPHAGTKEKTNIQSWGYGYGGRRGAGPYMGGGNNDVTQYTEGTLFIDMVDMKNNQLMWRGVGKGIVEDPSSPEESTKKVDAAAERLECGLQSGELQELIEGMNNYVDSLPEEICSNCKGRGFSNNIKLIFPRGQETSISEEAISESSEVTCTICKGNISPLKTGAVWSVTAISDFAIFCKNSGGFTID